MEGEPKTIDKCIGKFDQWAKWSKKDPIREIVFLIAVHILAVLSIILSPIIAIIMGNAYEKACWEEEEKENEEYFERWRKEGEEEYLKWVRSNGKYKGEDEYEYEYEYEYEDEDEDEYENKRG